MARQLAVAGAMVLLAALFGIMAVRQPSSHSMASALAQQRPVEFGAPHAVAGGVNVRFVERGDGWADEAAVASADEQRRDLREAALREEALREEAMKRERPVR